METLRVLTLIMLWLSLDGGQVQGKRPDVIMDIAILIDTSISMKTNERNDVVTILDKLIDKLGVSSEGIHYAVITFDYEVTIHRNFKDTRNHEIEEFKTELREHIMHEPQEWGTRADLALDLVSTQVFTRASGDRPNATKVLIVVTDGIPHIEKADNRPFIPYINTTKVLEAKCVHTTVIGVGDLVNAEDKMKEIAGSKGTVHPYSNVSALASYFDEISAAVCDKIPLILDVALLIDTSKSMNPKQRNAVDTTLNLLVNELCVSSKGNHYAFITFDYEATVHFNFKDPQYHKKEKLATEIREHIMHDPLEWGTRVDLAMDLAATQLFTPTGGDRPDGTNVLIVLTDGRPAIRNGDKRPFIPFINSTKVLENKGVDIIVIGVGDNLKKAEDEIKEIAGSKGTVHLFHNYLDLTRHFSYMYNAFLARHA